MRAALAAAYRDQETLTLWHLIPRVSIDLRKDVVERIVELVGTPDGLDLADVLALDESALLVWREYLEWEWLW